LSKKINKKNKKNKKVVRVLAYLLLFLFLCSALLSTSIVQTRLAKIFTNNLKENFNTNIVIKQVDFSFLGTIQLKGVEIRDHHNDTLIFVKKLSTSLLNAKKIVDNNVDLGSISLDGVHFYLKTYKDEKNDNLSVFVESFEASSPKDSLANPFLLKTSNIYINDLVFKISDYNKTNPYQFGIEKCGGSISDFKINGPNVLAKIRGLYFIDDRKIEITNLTTDFSFSPSKMLLKKTVLETVNSSIHSEIAFHYKRKNLRYFNDKVNLKASFTKSNVSLIDLSKLYGELGGGDLFHFSGNIEGTLNDFKAEKVHLLSDNGMIIKSDMHFTNAVNVEKGFIFDGNLKNVTANYQQLKSVLPNLLGKKLPSEFRRLGKFTLVGKTLITSKKIDLDVVVKSEIGTTKADLILKEIANIDEANYEGEVELVDFDLGKFFNEPLFGKITLGGNVDGNGFRIDNINTGIIGLIKQFNFNGYTYKNLNVNGLFQNRLFNGNLMVDDENLKLRFKGLADFSSAINKFDFTANVTLANLVKTNLFVRDSVSLIKGNFAIDVKGNTFDNIVGTSIFTDVVYTNQKQSYSFEKIKIASTVKDGIKTIEINKNIDSKDIAKGSLSGNFKLNQLSLMTQNALGSIYANYKPHQVDLDQFITFDFIIYNQIVDIFFPKVFIGKNTSISGRIKAKDDGFKLLFSSPKVIAYDNIIDSLSLRMDNKSTLYNTHLTASKINTKYYDVENLNLLNVTRNDTLFFKSEFKGAVGNEETFNMDFFYTFDENKKSVLGIQKSTFDFEENIWRINPAGDKENKVVFDIKKNEFEFSPFHLKSKEQEITFNGSLRDSTYKDLKVGFKNVKLTSFLPPIDSLSLKGVLNGGLNFKQNDGLYSPEGDLSVSNFKINSFEQGNLALRVKGENSYEKYAVNLTLSNDNAKSISANGNLDFSTKRPTLDLLVFLDKFKMGAFSPLGKDVLTKLRGEVSGEFKLSGFLRNPVMEGNLEMKDAGVKFPYLNVDYDFEGLTKIRLKDQSFIFDKLTLLDRKHNTSGDFIGSITHQNFEYWSLDLNINTQNLLVLDTKETEESLYFGTAFINGNARVTGLTDRLSIDINAKTNSGTTFVIPLSDLKTVDNYHLIHFNSKKIDKNDKEALVLKTLKGLMLTINLEVTNDATAEIVIDKKTGSALKGKGAGNLQIEIDTQGKFLMNGDFIVDEGKYDFKYGGLINKTFQVEKGGSISWNGSPSDASLNVTAVYTTKANPAQILENFNTNRKISIDLITKITGGLFNSKQEFDIQIPNVNPTIKSELEFKLNDNDVNEKTLQFLSLLALNKFYNPENIVGNSSAAIIGTTSNAISGVLSSLISSKDGTVQFDLGYDVADKSDINNLNTDDLVNVSVGTQISDKVIVNGRVGVPVGSKTQSSVVGEVKVEVLLNEKGNFRGVIFNRQNEIQYSNEEEGYTQGVGLTYQVDFNNLSELLQKIGLKKKNKNGVKKDTILAPKLNKLTRFKSKKNKNQ